MFIHKYSKEVILELYRPSQGTNYITRVSLNIESNAGVGRCRFTVVST